MARMGDIERETAEAVARRGHEMAGWFRNLHDHHDQEAHVTMPASRLSTIAAAIAELDTNPLISTLADHGLGKLLQPGEIQTVISFVAGLEAVRQPQRAVQQVQAAAEQAGA